MGRDSRGVKPVEAAIAVALIGGFLAAAGTYHARVVTRARELALRADLQAVRAGVDLFKARQGRFPETLEELRVEPLGTVQRRDRSPGWTLEQFGQELEDAFGNAYRYEASTGRVASASPGYEAW